MKGPFTRRELTVLLAAPLAAVWLGWALGWAGWQHATMLLSGFWGHDALVLAALGLVLALMGIALWHWRTAADRLHERDVIEGALRDSEARFRAIYDNAATGILLTAPEGAIVAANAAFQRMLGRDEAELKAVGWRNLLHADDAQAGPRRPLGATAAARGEGGVERCLIHKDGRPVWMRLTMSYAYDDKGRPSLGIAVVEDVTVRRRIEAALIAAHDDLEQRVERRTRELQEEIAERERIEATLRDSEARFRALIENALDFITVIDAKGVIRYLSPSIRTFGLDAEKMVGVSVFDFAHPEDRRRAHEAFAAVIAEPGKTVSLQARMRHGDGSWRLMEVIARNLLDDPGVGGVILNSRDITARQAAEQSARHLQTELAHVARLSTMGEMAAGFAHEINQPLTAIQNYARGCVRRLRGDAPPPIDEIREAMEQAARQAHRAGEIIRRIRWFIRRDEPELAPIDVNAVIEEAVDLMESEARHADVAVELDLAPGLPWAKGDAIQIQQILINLARNGIEAMADDRAGPRRLAVATARRADGDIEITVADSGAGIPAEVRDRLFEPFFTTKANGLGMGLSICRSIIERHGGRMAVDAPGPRGTAVRFTLKVFDEAAASPPPVLPAKPRDRGDATVDSPA